ncbi:hypothetical protein AWL63_10885 [Sphingomonas panacis]|uniref:Glycosyltransferase 2-like domain-containing protein n=1 Tax=Sphingomonas panacis TaxID=1560345 RepID=A0A1B3ZAF1_9SPHN|nr:glycosyltransferase [Sphingomonas panacis]AOH84396.1 hypothetical protein AWL63_10885 [Sphingomonas panacis]
MEKQLERGYPWAERGRVSHENVHRYALCLDYVEGKRVLDLASGAGHGTALLAQRAASVVGVDIDPQVIRAAQKRFPLPNVEFLAGDGLDLSFDNASFDVVVANEMIEYVSDPNRLLKEVRRILRPGGILLLSALNKLIHNRYKPVDHSYLSAMDIPEFSRLLGRHFDHVGMVGMRMALVSVGFRMAHAQDRDNLPSAETYLGDFRDAAVPAVAADELWLHEPEYVLALCSDTPIESGLPGPSLLVSRDEDLWREHERVMAWASGLHDEDRILRSELDQARAELQAERDQVLRMREEYARLDERFAELRQIGAATADTIATHRDAVDKMRTAHFTMSSRLLSRLTGDSVAADDQSIVEALFVLGQTLTEQRSRLAEARQREIRLVEAETALASLRREVSEQVARAVALSDELDRKRAEHSAITSQLASVNLERTQAEAMHANAAEAARRDASSLRATQVELEEVRQRGDAAVAAARQDLTRTVRELDEARALRDTLQRDLADARTEAATLRSELEKARTRPADVVVPASGGQQASTAVQTKGRAGSSVSAASGSQRELERFVKVHQSVSAQLARASRDVSGRIPAARSRPTSAWNVKRWATKVNPYVAPFRTVLFNGDWIAEQDPSVGRVSLARYLRDSRLWTLDPHPVFAAGEYLQGNADVAATKFNPLQHYREHGWREGRSPHPYFANDWYLAQNPDVMAAGSISPLEHYLEHGWREGRWPNPLFNPRAYLDRYPDVAAAKTEPLTHFLAYGRREGREIPSASVNPVWTSLLPTAARSKTLLDFILQDSPLAIAGADASPAIEQVQGHAPAWPPERLNDFWLPQRLRDFIIEGYSEDAVHLYVYLCSVMAAFQTAPEDFPESEPCRRIVERARNVSRTRAATLPEMPDSSIIIPVYNNIMDTLLCICSVLEDDTRISYEIIVADDGSNDATAQIITSLSGVVRYVRQPRNYGFLGNCNQAAKQARGRHIVLLNNDTLVMPRWLDALLRPFDLYDKIGLSGSKLLSWDGTLQEAGGIYWKDGSAWNFGRGADARAPEFCYLKDVDYVSGAAIAVPAAIWREMHGFDEIYAPAYCEDSDLAFRLRAAGYRTVLNPHSEVLHHEGRSHGRDLTSGVKAYQVRNQQIFLERWKETLERDHYPNAENVLRARDRSGRKRHVLVIDHYVPQWDQDAGSRSTFMCIEAFLTLGYAVTFWPDNLWRDPHYTLKLQELGVEVIYGWNYLDGFGDFIESRSDLYDAAFVNRPHVAEKYLTDLRKRSKQTRILFYGHDLHFKRMMAAKAAGEPVSDADIASMRHMEFEVCRKADVVMYPDPEEVHFMEEQIGGRRVFAALPVFAFDRHMFARGARMLETIRSKAGQRLLFVGGFNHAPNRDGIQWFMESVFPELQRKLDHVHLTIAGSKPPESITSLASNDIEVVGFVSDDRLAELYDEASVIVAPLRYGAGVKGKVIEAMAMGVPLVTTPTGAQGLANPDELMFVASDAADLAEAIQRALGDRDEAWLRASRALERVNQQYSAEVLERIFRDLIER